MNSTIFNNNIQKVIEECAHNFYLVHANKSIFCTCINHTTKQPDEKCKLCLGTGHKITIRVVRGASNEELKGSISRGDKVAQIARNYFVSFKYKIEANDLMIDDNEIFYAFLVSDMKGLKGVKTHQEILAVKQKNNHDIALRNFYEIIEKSKRK